MLHTESNSCIWICTIYSIPLYRLATFVCFYFAVFVIGWQYVSDERRTYKKNNPLSELCNCWMDYPEMSMKLRKRVSWSEHMEFCIIYFSCSHIRSRFFSHFTECRLLAQLTYSTNHFTKLLYIILRCQIIFIAKILRTQWCSTCFKITICSSFSLPHDSCLSNKHAENRNHICQYVHVQHRVHISLFTFIYFFSI